MKNRGRYFIILNSTRLRWPAIFILGLALSCGALTLCAIAANGSVTYTYDELGRVITASYDTGVIVIYTYDSNGNRLSQIINVNTSTGTWGSFNWGAANW